MSDATASRALFGQRGFVEVGPRLFDETATGHAIQGLVTDDLTSLSENDSLILYFAGHGSTRRQQLDDIRIHRGYLLPVDATDRVASWIELEDWLRRVSTLPPRHILVILDACFSGSALKRIIRPGRHASSRSQDALDALHARRSRQIITSTLDDQIAIDAGPVHGHSLFTSCLLDGLGERRVNNYAHRDRRVTTGSDLGHHLRSTMLAWPDVERYGPRQTADFGYLDYDARGEMLIPLDAPPSLADPVRNVSSSGAPASGVSAPEAPPPADADPPRPPAETADPALARAPDGAVALQVEAGLPSSPATGLLHVPSVEVQDPPPWAAAAGCDKYGSWATFEVGGVEQRMRWIPAGTFLMGSPDTECGRFDHEGPQHEVTLTRGYWLGETPVTQALWDAVKGQNPSYFRGREGRDRPVERVSWDNCQDFLADLNTKLTGLAARLPTEAEWERACRGGTTTATWVDNLSEEMTEPEIDTIAWYSGNSSGETHPVGRKTPNPYGLHDMLGNVYEWCADAGDRSTVLRSYTAVSVTDPAASGQGLRRVLRGGSWVCHAWHIRAARRLAFPRGLTVVHVGFRLLGGQGSPVLADRSAGRFPRSE